MTTTRIIVSGLPRSGTSLMMQMLAAGGIPPLTDEQRAADDDNPRGYFEFEAVKQMKNGAAWMADAEGKAIKVIHALLADLPDGFDYRVIFMKRDLDEVVRSQRTMLDRTGKAGASLPAAALVSAFEGQYRKVESWLADQPSMDVLYVSYNDLMQAPEVEADRVAVFLDGMVTPSAMLSAIDPALYRQRQ